MIILRPKYFMTMTVCSFIEKSYFEKKLLKAFNNLTTSSILEDFTWPSQFNVIILIFGGRCISSSNASLVRFPYGSQLIFHCFLSWMRISPYTCLAT